jgi:hypothetical protein
MRNVLRLQGSAISLLLALGFTAVAQEKSDKGPEVRGAATEGLPAKDIASKAVPGEPAKEPEFGFLQTPVGIRLSAAIQMIAMPNPVAAIGVRLAAASGEFAPLLWPEWEVALDAPPPLPVKYLSDLKDGTAIPGNLGAKPPEEWTREERAYLQILNDALIDSRLVPAKFFEEAAQKNRHVTFDHLWRNPGEYRGEIVPVTGRMIRFRRWPTPSRAKASGIESVYEAWVVGETPKRNPYCILFTDLPAGMEEKETMDHPVRFYGYYIKKFRYQADKADRMTHLLIGPTIYPETVPPPPPPAMPFSRFVLFGIAGGSLALLFAIVAMGLWFRRGDRAIHSKLAAMREKSLNLSDDEAGASPEQTSEGPDAGEPGGPRSET